MKVSWSLLFGLITMIWFSEHALSIPNAQQSSSGIPTQSEPELSVALASGLLGEQVFTVYSQGYIRVAPLDNVEDATTRYFSLRQPYLNSQHSGLPVSLIKAKFYAERNWLAVVVPGLPGRLVIYEIALDEAKAPVISRIVFSEAMVSREGRPFHDFELTNGYSWVLTYGESGSYSVWAIGGVNEQGHTLPPNLLLERHDVCPQPAKVTISGSFVSTACGYTIAVQSYNPQYHTNPIILRTAGEEPVKRMEFDPYGHYLVISTQSRNLNQPQNVLYSLYAMRPANLTEGNQPLYYKNQGWLNLRGPGAEFYFARNNGLFFQSGTLRNEWVSFEPTNKHFIIEGKVNGLVYHQGEPAVVAILRDEKVDFYFQKNGDLVMPFYSIAFKPEKPQNVIFQKNGKHFIIETRDTIYVYSSQRMMRHLRFAKLILSCVYQPRASLNEMLTKNNNYLYPNYLSQKLKLLSKQLQEASHSNYSILRGCRQNLWRMKRYSKSHLALDKIGEYSKIYLPLPANNDNTE